MFLQVCPVCEHRNPRGSRFCNDCGSPLQLRFCPSCHAAEDVMSLECRTCGERLPVLVLTDTAVTPDTLPPPPDTLWQTRAPDPAPFEPTMAGQPLDLTGAPSSKHPFAEAMTAVAANGPSQNGARFDDATVVAEAAAPPLASHDGQPERVVQPRTVIPDERELPLQALVADGREAAHVAGAALAEVEAAPIAQAAPPVASTSAQRAAMAGSVARSPSIIERLSAAQPTFEFQARTIAPPPDLSVSAAAPDEGIVEPSTLAPESANATADPDEPEVQPTVLGGTDPIALPLAEIAAFSAGADSTVWEADAAPQAETASEIAVSHEAETLVEASVAPLTGEPPVEITVADTQVDDIASQLRTDAWRHVLPIDGSPMTPAVVRIAPPPDRRLSMRRVGLAVGSVGAIVAAVVFVRLHPGAGSATFGTAASQPAPGVAAEQAASAQGTATQSQASLASAQTSSSTQAAASQAPAATVPAPAPSPAPAPVTVMPAGAGAVAAAATPAAARTADAAPAATGDAASAAAQAVVPKTNPVAARDSTVAETKASSPAPRRPAVARGSSEANAPASARGAAIESPRACTPAIAALGLCTLDPSQEKN